MPEEAIFEDALERRQAAALGMWTFLATEVLLFGALFVAYALNYHLHADAFREAARRLEHLLAGANTAVLLSSSWTMAMAVHSAAAGRRRSLLAYLAATMLLGAAFLGVKAIEYRTEYEHGLFPGRFTWQGPAPARLFFNFYYALTGLHAAHVSAGLAALAWLWLSAFRARLDPRSVAAVENTGLYWHLVDMVWIFLYPMLYLMGRAP